MALASDANSADAARMRQQRASRDEENRDSENADDAERMSQHRVSRDGATHASGDAAGAAWMRQLTKLLLLKIQIMLNG